MAVGTDPKGNEVKDTSGTTIDNDTPTVVDISNNVKGQIALVKTGVFVDTNNDGFAQVGEKVNYAFSVTNTGNVTVTNIVVTDPKVSVNGIKIPTLAPGQTIADVFTATYTLTQADIDAGQVTNTALAVGTDPKGNEVRDTSGTTIDNDTPTVVDIALHTGLTVVKTANTDSYSNVGDIINYTIQVLNSGNVTLYKITVTDPLTGLNTLIDELTPGTSKEFIQNYTVTQIDLDRGSVTNVAAASGFGPNSNPITNSDEVVVEAEIVLGCGNIVVHNAFSPNGDGINELFIIDNIDNTLCYPTNSIEIYNRWGGLVYETTGYDNVTKVFNGVSSGKNTISQATGLPAATYYYILTYTSVGINNKIETNIKNGYIYLSK